MSRNYGSVPRKPIVSFPAEPFYASRSRVVMMIAEIRSDKYREVCETSIAAWSDVLTGVDYVVFTNLQDLSVPEGVIIQPMTTLEVFGDTTVQPALTSSFESYKSKLKEFHKSFDSIYGMIDMFKLISLMWAYDMPYEHAAVIDVTKLEKHDIPSAAWDETKKSGIVYADPYPEEGFVENWFFITHKSCQTAIGLTVNIMSRVISTESPYKIFGDHAKINASRTPIDTANIVFPLLRLIAWIYVDPRVYHRVLEKDEAEHIFDDETDWSSHSI